MRKLWSWLAIWIITWMVVLAIWGKNPAMTPVPGRILLIFILAALIAVGIFTAERRIWFRRINPLQMAIVILGIALFAAVYPFSWLNCFVIIAHVIFQQIMIAFLVFMPSRMPPARKVVLFYGLSHLVLIFYFTFTWGLTITGLSILGGLCFAYLLQKPRYGIALSYLLHLGFYAVLMHLLASAWI